MKNDFFEESEDEFENYENEYSGNIEMVVEEAEGLQVLTTYDSNGYVVDARVCSSEESSDIDKKVHLAKYIDHTLLKPDATPEQIMSLCREAKENHFASVCVNSCWVRLCAELLRGTM
jgi:deoxyribose-phosphate aldolase